MNKYEGKEIRTEINCRICIFKLEFCVLPLMFISFQVQTSNRSLSPLRDPDLTMRNLQVPTSAIPSISTRRISAMYVVLFFFFQNQHKLHLLHCLTERIWCSNPSNVRMNMSLPVSPCSSPLRQYRQSNRSCMPSPPHPAYSAGAANYSPINNALYPKRPSNHVPDPWLEISQLKAPPFDSPRRL